MSGQAGSSNNNPGHSFGRGFLRRPNKAMSVDECREFLSSHCVGRLGTVGPDGYPYIVPIHYGFVDSIGEQGCLYLHCAKEGHKLANISNNPSVCFEADNGGTVVPGESICNFSTRYSSVVVFGKAVVVHDMSEARAGLVSIVKQTAPETQDVSIESMPDEAIARTCVLRIDIEMVTGKASRG